MRDRLDAGWVTAARTEPIKHENTRFEEPNGVVWVEFGVFELDSASQVTVGINNALHRYVGRAVASVFQPIEWDAGSSDGGNTDAEAVADVVRLIFLGPLKESLVITVAANHNIYCRPPAIDTVGRVGAWYQHNVVVLYHRDAIG